MIKAIKLTFKDKKIISNNCESKLTINFTECKKISRIFIIKLNTYKNTIFAGSPELMVSEGSKQTTNSALDYIDENENVQFIQIWSNFTIFYNM